MHLFVAGATGAIGRVLVPLLVAEGHQVVGTARTAAGAERLRAQGARAAELDVFDREAVSRAVADTAPDAIVHQLTALGSGDRDANAAVRRTGSRNLVDAAAAAGVPRVVAQSISWAYEPGPGPAAEDTPLDVLAPEPRAATVGGVLALEAAVAELEEHVILRYGTLYGPGTWYERDGLVAGRLAAGELPANDGVSSFLHVEDAARAVLAALDWPAGPVNITDDEPAAARDWVPVLAAALSRPAPAPTAGGAAWERGASNGLARSRGWKPVHGSWRSGFAGA